jgi:hypothetical protein
VERVAQSSRWPATAALTYQTLSIRPHTRTHAPLRCCHRWHCAGVERVARSRAAQGSAAGADARAGVVTRWKVRSLREQYNTQVCTCPRWRGRRPMEGTFAAGTVRYTSLYLPASAYALAWPSPDGRYVRCGNSTIHKSVPAGVGVRAGVVAARWTVRSLREQYNTQVCTGQCRRLRWRGHRPMEGTFAAGTVRHMTAYLPAPTAPIARASAQKDKGACFLAANLGCHCVADCAPDDSRQPSNSTVLSPLFSPRGLNSGNTK